MTPSSCCTTAARGTSRSPPPPAASPSSCTFPGGTTPSTRRRRSPSPWNSAWTPAVAAGALAHFTGASRRFEFKGEGRGVRVYDDYAHHPTEVRAALSAARSVAGGHKLHVLFQPHLFSRTREFAEEFAAALNTADTALVLDIYPAREDPIPGVSSQLIAAHLGAGGRLVGPGAEAVQSVVSAAAPGDIVLTVGAGDVTAYGPLIVAALNDGADRNPERRCPRCLAPAAPATGRARAVPVRARGPGVARRHLGLQRQRGTAPPAAPGPRR